MSDKKRNLSIDIAKGIGILFVVIGHSKVALNQEVARIIFSFHMPLFFFLSGIFLKATTDFKNIARKKFHALLKPYYSTLLIVGGLYVVLNKTTIETFFFGTLYASSGTIPWGPLWFLPHLFLVYLFVWCISQVLSLGYLSGIASSVVLLMVGYCIGDYFWNLTQPFLLTINPHIGLPFNLDILFISSAYFILGVTFREKLLSFKTNYFLLTTSILVFISLHVMFNYTIDMNNRRYDDLIVCTLQALAGIYIVLAFSNELAKYFFIGKILGYLCSASLIVFIFHVSLLNKTYNFLINYSNQAGLIIVLDLLVTIVGTLFIFEFINRMMLLRLAFMQTSK